MDKPIKPLGRKAYGSIPHLPGSRLGPGDYHCHEGQARIACETLRDRKDRVIVMEKLDGACCSIANIDGNIVALSRAGYLASDALYDHLKLFGVWVQENEAAFADSLLPGQRLVGEWLALAHGTIYSDGPPFIAFDLMSGGNRLPHDVMRRTADGAGIPTAHILSDGPPVSIEDALDMIGEYGHHGAQELPEGAVWKIERDGQFDFNCKFVRHEKEDGKYLPGIGATDPIWMRGVK